MYKPENPTAAIANAMSAVGYEISDQLYNALETEFAAALEEDQEEGNSASLDTFLVSLAYAAARVSMERNNQ